MKFNSRGILATFAGLALVGSLVWYVWPDEEPAPAATPPAPASVVAIPVTEPTPTVPPAPSPIRKPPAQLAQTTTQAPADGKVENRQRPRLTVKPGQPIPELFPHQAERDQLVKLASTYDPKNIPFIAPSLRHEDATVRESARQALVQMGDAAAIPYLEQALKNTRDSEESKLIREIIEFLSLPHFNDVVTSNAVAPAPHP